MWDTRMWDKMVAWMVERAMPPNIIDPVQGIIAAEAAEYGIRQAARVASIAGVILFVVIAALLYSFVPSKQISQGPTEASKAASQLGADNAELRQANEELQKKLDDLTKKRLTLQGKVTNLEGQVADLSRQLQAARRSAAIGQKQAEAPKKTLQPSKRASRPTKTRVGTKPRSGSIGSEGRTIRDPTERKEATNPSAPQAAASAPTESASPVAPSAPTEPAPPVAASAPPLTLEPPPAQGQPTVAPTAVPTQQRRQAAQQPVATDPPLSR